MTQTIERHRTDDVGFRPTPAGRAFTTYVNHQIEAILARDVGLRHGRDPIHDTRVAIRRLRSTLRVFRPLLDGDAADRTEADLKWFAGLLGEVRDCQVQGDRFAEALLGLPAPLILGPVKSDIRNHLASVERPARARVDEAMDTARYLSMMADVRRWLTEPPAPTTFTVDDLVARANRAARKADRRLARAVDGDDDAALHSARKAAKRARYAAELVQPVKKSAKRKVKRYKEIQSVLGDHQDTVVASDMLRRLGASMCAPADRNGFTYGLLYAREETIARDCRRKAGRLD